MESPDSPSYISSPENPKRSSSNYNSDNAANSENMENTSYIKFLVSNAAAGSVIGKGGSTITDFQSQSGARIQLSRNHEFFPGTSDRIIMVSGRTSEILRAVDLILNKLQAEIQSEDGDDVDIRTRVRLVVPNSCCGAIIGKGGATIKSFIEDSHAVIKISPQDHGYLGGDRLVTLTGSLEEQMRAIDLILPRLTEDPLYLQSMNAPFSYPGVMYAGFHRVPYPYMLPPVGPATYNAVNYGPNGGGGRFQNSKEDRNNSVTIGVADEHIGLVLGRGGRNIAEISQVSGARIKISDRGDFMSGTSDRKVTITGSQRAIQIAEDMIMQKVDSVSEG